ncbi:toxin TcdB middle/N-terminal domain-containing protein [Lysobacter sp. TY2-98]|uniref:toxin TcdB middle/N-terminal domain-containing protein n=1 Tax=Lysobacter sp. TY2-98 TaxID=2290922 RepID=UPI0013B3D978|nr:toxin TcdB middle/N-terminal domain-containing protein [Lysobacter sp. TY2-98]
MSTGLPPLSVYPFPSDPESDRVGATPAEFRVDESGAATYDIPLYAAPGTAGVQPHLSLHYSSQGGSGVLGRGWAINGLSAISRCRATREAADFVANGVPVDGNPQPVSLDANDRYCLDGQRLIAYDEPGAACLARGGYTGVQYRTEIESFQRVCAYGTDANGAKFFTVERKDGSTSWYGDRDNDDSQNRPDGYVNSQAPGKQAVALAWAQTRFQDSMGNYIDYRYEKGDGTNADVGEHLLTKVLYTGKTVLPGQNGSPLQPYAELDFNYEAAFDASGYVSGGITRQTRRLASVTSRVDPKYNGNYVPVRHYTLGYVYGGSSGSVLQSVKECADQTEAVCLGATKFDWTSTANQSVGFDTEELFGSIPNGSLTKFEGMKFADVDGDGRRDLVWIKDASSGEACPTELIYAGLSRMAPGGQPSFSFANPNPYCAPAELEWSAADSTWFLLDYDGDGRDDLFLRGNARYIAWRATGDPSNPFDTSVDLLASLAQPIPAGSTKDNEPQHADLNGDGLIDILYPKNGALVARLMQKGGAYGYQWGSELPINLVGGGCTTNCFEVRGLYHKDNYQQLNDFNGDARSDLLVNLPGTGCAGGGGGTPPPPGDPRPPQQPQIANTTEGVLAATATSSTCTHTFPFVVQSIDGSGITATLYGNIEFSPTDGLSFADLNGDGLSDVVMHGRDYNGMSSFNLNTGVGFVMGGGSGGGYGAVQAYPAYLQVADVNGDGRADLVYPDPYTRQKFVARMGLPSGKLSDPVQLGGTWTGCGDVQCLAGYSYLFEDFDGDGNAEFMRIKWGDSNSATYFSRLAPERRFKPRDAIVKITNGLGAETEIAYSPLTMGALYGRGAGARNAFTWGRGSPVRDLAGPMYVVSRAASSSPQAGAPDAKAAIYYRYEGARIQAGGRGFLGFAAVETIDANNPDGYVVSRTEYRQDFPFVGVPQHTTKRLVAGGFSPSPCVAGALSESCFATVPAALPSLGGTLFEDSTQIWEAPQYAVAAQRPIEIRTSGSVERSFDAYSGAELKRTQTAFGYGEHGNATSTAVDTFEGGGSQPMATVVTSNVYTDDAARWRLGRMTSSTVTHRRPNTPDVVRHTSFDYDMSVGGGGLLREERTEPNVGGALELRTVYTLDAFGNRYVTAKCSNLPGQGCGPASFAALPSSPLQVNRYSRVGYDARGRLITTAVEPFMPNGTSATEYATQQVLSFDKFGNAEKFINVDGVTSWTGAGALGRPMYTWQQTTASSSPNEGGRYTLLWYRRCGTNSNQVACPAGAVARQQAFTTGAAVKWTYTDVLGRPVLTVAQSFNQNVSDQDAVARCTRYDAYGRTVGISNPFFLPGVSTNDLADLPSNVCQAAADWTVTNYDAIGRVASVREPNNALTRYSYTGLQVSTTDDLMRTTRQLKNALGEVVQTIAANGIAVANDYDSAGRLVTVRRNVGAGEVRNEFSYDVLGRKTSQRDPDSGERWFDYNAAGDLVAQRDAAYNRLERVYDGRGRIITARAIDPSGAVLYSTAYTYDGAPGASVGRPWSETTSGNYSTASDTVVSYRKEYIYDTLGRPSQTKWTVDGASYSAAIQYDTLSRPFKQQDATGRWTKTQFNGRGFVIAICGSDEADSAMACSSAYARMRSADAFGNITEETRADNNSLTVSRSYVPKTGRLNRICAGVNCSLVDEEYVFDTVGNLYSQRKEGRYAEKFEYDSVDRITRSYAWMRNGVQVNQTLQTFAYDGLGNVCAINGLKRSYGTGSTCETIATPTMGTGPVEEQPLPPGTGPVPPRPGDPVLEASAYTPPSSPRLRTASSSATTAQTGRAIGGFTPTRPHAALAAQEATGTQATTYLYDDHGNQIQRDAPGSTRDRTISYNLDDQAFRVSMGSGQMVRFWYAPDGSRYKRVEGGKTTITLGDVDIVVNMGATSFKRTIGGVVQQTITGTTIRDDYLFFDRLGSLIRITDATGAVQDSLDYRAFGDRRSITDPSAAGTGTAITPKGFGGHDTFDQIDVIHMGARLFDPGLGRFLQADPVVQSASSADGWNAYSYVLNNPLRYSDPTGALGVEERQWVAAAVAIVAAYFGYAAVAMEYYGTAVGIAVAGGFASGAIASQSLRGGVFGAMSGLISGGFGVSAAMAGTSGGLAGWAVQTFAGGVMGSLQGGNFGHSMLAAGLTMAAMPAIGQIGSVWGRAAIGALVGGTASEVSGGKFANGAVSGAIQAAMSGAPEQSANQDALVVEYRDPNAVSKFADKAPGGRQGFLRSVVERGKLGDPRRFVYNPKQPTAKDGSQPRASTFSDGRTEVYPIAFDLNYYDFGSTLYHEYVHLQRYEVYARVGFRYTDKTQPQYMMEAEGYAKMLTPSNPFFSGMSKRFFYEMRYNDGEVGFGALTDANQARVQAGQFNCAASPGC